MLGKIGPKPIPIRSNPTKEIFPKGRDKRIIPKDETIIPLRTIVLSDALIDIKPEIILPTIIPAKYNEIHLAASSGNNE